MEINVTWHNANPGTIWAKLAQRLGREPTSTEVKAEMQRISNEGLIERAAVSKLKHQRK